MHEKLSKTARAAVQAGVGVVRRIPVAWVMESKPGKIQTRPYKVCFVAGEAEEFVAQDPERFYIVKWDENRRR